jgi:hypothetical protein
MPELIICFAVFGALVVAGLAFIGLMVVLGEL